MIANLLFSVMQSIALAALTLLVAWPLFRLLKWAVKRIAQFLRQRFFLVLIVLVAASCMKYPAQSKVVKQNTNRYNSTTGR